MAQIIPQLSARDVDGYLKFLTEAFGFEVTEYWRDPSHPTHINVEVAYDGAVVGIGRAAEERTSPTSPSGPHIGLYVVIDDVDAHYAKASAAGPRSPWNWRTSRGDTGCTEQSTPKVTTGDSRRE